MPEIVKLICKIFKQKIPENIFLFGQIITTDHYGHMNLMQKNKNDFVGSLNGLILKGETKLTNNDFEGLSIATWPHYYAWHMEHKKYILERINHPAEVYNLNNQVYYKDTAKKLILPDNSISVFGYENNKITLGYATLADYDTQNKHLLQNFYENIYEILEKNNFFLILKRKENLVVLKLKDLKSFLIILKKEKLFL